MRAAAPFQREHNGPVVATLGADNPYPCLSQVAGYPGIFDMLPLYPRRRRQIRCPPVSNGDGGHRVGDFTSFVAAKNVGEGPPQVHRASGGNMARASAASNQALDDTGEGAFARTQPVLGVVHPGGVQPEHTELANCRSALSGVAEVRTLSGGTKFPALDRRAP